MPPSLGRELHLPIPKFHGPPIVGERELNPVGNFPYYGADAPSGNLICKAGEHAATPHPKPRT